MASINSYSLAARALSPSLRLMFAAEMLATAEAWCAPAWLGLGYGYGYGYG